MRAVAKRAGLFASMLVIAAVVAMPSVALAANQSVDIIGVGGGYSPSTANVNPGDTVTWTNRDQTTAHNAFCGGPPDCPVAMVIDNGHLVASGGSQSFTFKYSGTYNYHCSAHPNMQAKVIVSGNVNPPSSGSGSASGGGTGSGSGSAGAGSAPAAGSGSAQSSSASGQSNLPTRSAPGQPAGANPAGGGTTAGAGATDPAVTGEAVKNSLAGITLPRPNVIVNTPKNPGTARWVMWASAGALVVCGFLFAFAWFGPPVRLPGGKR